MGWANHHPLHPKQSIINSRSVMSMVEICRKIYIFGKVRRRCPPSRDHIAVTGFVRFKGMGHAKN